MKKVKIAVSILIIALGAVLFAIAALGKLDNFFAGYGGALVGVGAVRLYRQIRYETSPRYAQKVTVENNDERNLYLARKAQGTAFYAGCIILAAAVLVLQFMGYKEYAALCGYICCLYLIIYVIAYRIYRKTC